jgi:hypothetical protein
VRHLILEVADRIAARRWLADSLSGRGDGVPQITTGDWGAAKPNTCFNIGLTYEGLRALGTPSSSLETFPNEFVEGMNARALKLGDVGASAPQNWPAPFNEPKRIHLIATIYAEEVAQLDEVQQRALTDEGALRLLGIREGCSFQATAFTSGIGTTSRNRGSRTFTTQSVIPTDKPGRRSAPCCWDIRPTWKV